MSSANPAPRTDDEGGGRPTVARRRYDRVETYMQQGSTWFATTTDPFYPRVVSGTTEAEALAALANLLIDEIEASRAAVYVT